MSGNGQRARLRAVLHNGSTHFLRLGSELEPQRALEYFSRVGTLGPYPALDRDWLETESGCWIRREAIVELAVVSDAPEPRP